MPEHGLDEALVSVRDILQFHIEKPASNALLIHRRQVTGVVGDAQKRADLIIPD